MDEDTQLWARAGIKVWPLSRRSSPCLLCSASLLEERKETFLTKEGGPVISAVALFHLLFSGRTQDTPTLFPVRGPREDRTEPAVEEGC